MKESLRPYNSDGAEDPGMVGIPEPINPAVLPHQPYFSSRNIGDASNTQDESVDPREECDRTMITPIPERPTTRGRDRVRYSFVP